ncbi:hypothetical protein LL250_13800, partial [Halomonas meridiana]|nr:hypothetical protein [Halomonas meridiana]
HEYQTCSPPQEDYADDTPENGETLADTQLDTHDNAQGRLMLDDSRDATPCYAWWPLSEIQSSESDTFAPSWLPELLASVLFSEMMMPTSAARL